MANLTVALILLTFVMGLWIGAKYTKSPIVQFFGRNDWFVGVFLILIGYANFVSYPISYVRNMSLVLIIFGLLILLFVITKMAKE